PPAGGTVRALSQIEVTFSEDVLGVDAADLLINNQPATNVMARPGAVYLFQFPPPPNGLVQVAWASGHGITDVALTPNSFAGGSWGYQLDPNASVGDLIINEILAANQNGLNDPSATPEDPDPLDWIEIYNRGTNLIDLAGWSLSDDPNEPGQWIFPAKLIQPGQYLVVFASGLDIRNPTGTNRFHTNFKLSISGEFLGLYSPDSPRVLVSGFSPAYPEQRTDKSYGYDSHGELRYFATPTPGRANGNSTINGVVAPVHFSTPRGYFAQPLNLALSSPTPGSFIRYTTDGSEPTEITGQPYLSPLRLTNTTLLRAAAFRTNLLPSVVRTHSYFFNLSSSLRSLPIMSLVTAQNNLTGPNGIIGISNVVQQGDGTYVPATTNGYHNPSKHGLAWERPTSIEFMRPQDNSGFQIDCGMRVQGSDYQRPRTTPSSKFSFRLYFRGDYGPGRLDYPLFPLTPAHDFDQIVLRAGFNEQSNPFIRDELTRRLSHDMGEVAAHGNMVILFINGQLAPVSPYYNPCERVHEEFLQSYLGGGDEWDVVSPSFAQSAGPPGVVDGDRADFQSLVNYVRTQSTTTPAVYQTISRRLDLKNFVDYCLLNAYLAMGDWPQNNWRAGKDRSNPNAPWRFICWDGEWAAGIYSRTASIDIFAQNGPGPDLGGLSSISDSEIAQMYQRLVLNPEFRLLWADRIQKHFFNGGALTGDNFSNRVNQLRVELQSLFTMTDSKLLGWPRDRLSIIMAQFNTNG
ncbi:MAG TPA: CotH kinase family protein, partial [Tepidisphaeraceae bacterium]|nr:CotH kinase family protein [Tepidisphaeraceae bacterium]